MTEAEKAELGDDTLDSLRDPEDLGKRLVRPLRRAATAGNVERVVQLLAAGAPANTICADGDYVLHKIAAMGDQTGVEALLDNGADVDALDLDGRTALHEAVACDSPETDAHGGFVGVINTLLQHGASVSNASNTGFTALHAAAMAGNLDAISVLVEAGADVNRRGPMGATPLHLAAQNNHAECVTALCELDADRNPTNILGNTPLKYAASNRSFDAMQALLETGDMDIDCRLLGITETALDVAVRLGDVDSARLLLWHGADVNGRDSYGHTPLHKAALHNTPGMVDLLVEAGANVRSRGHRDKKTPLHIAAEVRAVSAARALLRHGADVNKRDVSEMSPLHRAAFFSADDGSAETIELLLKWGADEKAVDRGGHTPAQVVPAANNPNVLGLLARASADRAWRRRGLMMMCRSRLRKEPQDLPEQDASPRPTKSPRAEGGTKGGVDGGGGAAGSSDGLGIAHRESAENASVSDVVTGVAGMGELGVFKNVMKFL